MLKGLRLRSTSSWWVCLTLSLDSSKLGLGVGKLGTQLDLGGVQVSK